ncbi:MAG: energy-coupling factor transporter transmembrane component T family protein [Candidatus Bathyarchaeia archaeon]
MSVIAKFFGYTPLNTIMHRFDARVKFLWFFAFILPAMAWSDPICLIGLLCVIFIFGALAKAELSIMFKTILLPFPGYIMILLFNIFAFDFTVKQMLSWELLYLGWLIPKMGSFGPYGRVSLESLIFTLGVCLRLAILVSASRLFLKFTSPSDITTALNKLKVPMEFTTAISIAFGYLPELARQVTSILEAQKSRGWRVDSKNPVKIVKAYIPVVMPIVSRSMMRSEFLATAIVSRGFGTGSRRISLKETSFALRDYAAAILLAIFLVVSIIAGTWVLNIAHFRFTTFLLRQLW